MIFAPITGFLVLKKDAVIVLAQKMDFQGIAVHNQPKRLEQGDTTNEKQHRFERKYCFIFEKNFEKTLLYGYSLLH